VRLPRAWICPHCGNVDDLEVDPFTGASRRCPCPHDEVTERTRRRAVATRHRHAVARARSCSLPRAAS